jgi:hypothetical protein
LPKKRSSAYLGIETECHHFMIIFMNTKIIMRKEKRGPLVELTKQRSIAKLFLPKRSSYVDL